MSGHTVLRRSSERMAMDGYENHGVFTFVLVEGMQSGGQ